MGNVIEIDSARRAQACPWAEEDLVEGFNAYVRKSWRPVQGVRRGAIKRVMRLLYQQSGHGADWLCVCPIDLVQAALPRVWDAYNVEYASYLTLLLWTYLHDIGALSPDDKDFAFAWTRDAERLLYKLLAQQPVDDGAGGSVA